MNIKIIYEILLVFALHALNIEMPLSIICFTIMPVNRNNVVKSLRFVSHIDTEAQACVHNLDTIAWEQ